MTSATILGVVVGYLLILLAIGLWGNRDSHDMAGYYVAALVSCAVSLVVIVAVSRLESRTNDFRFEQLSGERS